MKKNRFYYNFFFFSYVFLGLICTRKRATRGGTDVKAHA